MPKNADSVHQMETHSGFLPAVSDDVHFMELRDGADEQMRQQVLSYSKSPACALLVAGHRLPVWLLQPLADVAYLFFSRLLLGLLRFCSVSRP